MKSLLVTIAIAAVALPGAAFAADGEKKCCCEEMKQHDQDCCDEKTAPAADDHAGHAEHADHAEQSQAK
jgi:hypothetical protein